MSNSYNNNNERPDRTLAVVIVSAAIGILLGVFLGVSFDDQETQVDKLERRVNDIEQELVDEERRNCMLLETLIEQGALNAKGCDPGIPENAPEWAEETDYPQGVNPDSDPSENPESNYEAGTPENPPGESRPSEVICVPGTSTTTIDPNKGGC